MDLLTYLKQKLENYQIDGGINTKISKYSTSRNELLNLVNMHFSSIDAVSKRPGSSFYLGATVSGQVGGMYEFNRLNGESYIIATANTTAYKVTSSWTPFKTGLLNNGIFDFVTFVDRLFMTNGQDFFKYDGTNESNYSLPPGQSTSSYGATAAFSASGGLSGIYVVGYGYLNDRGYFGPASRGVTVSLNGTSFNSILYFGMTFPSSYGVTSIRLYRSQAGFVSMFGTTSIGLGATFTDFSPISTQPQPPYLWFTLAPRFIEIFNNQLMLLGFSSALSTFYFSDIAEPEGVRPESTAEVRTNDGDFITGGKAYLNDFVIGKKNSLHLLSGDNPDNFILQQITDQYGSLSNRCMVVYNSLLVVLDEKGFIEYNGAVPRVISDRIEPIIKRINMTSAINRACGIHNKQDNEIWFSVPLDGSTVNNAIIVYDYLADGWLVYEGLKMNSLTLGTGNLSKKSVLFGGYTGFIGFMDDSIESDFGAAITCTIQTPYTNLMGQSTEEQFRRFYVNLEPVIGSSQPLDISFMANYGSTVQATFLIYQNPFQTRVDFGIPAKSLSAQIVHSSASLSLTVYGWTFESRYQRSV